MLKWLLTPIKLLVDKVFKDSQDPISDQKANQIKAELSGQIKAGLSDQIKAELSNQIKPELSEGSATRTTQYLAYILMGVYCTCIVVLLGAGIYLYTPAVPATDLIPAKPADDRWLLVFKDSFAFLAGLLATIVGYYFGNRNVNDALEKAKKEEAKATEAIKQVEAQEAKTTEKVETVKAEEAKKTVTLLSEMTTLVKEGKTDDQIPPGAPPTKTENELSLPVPTSSPKDGGQSGG